MSYLNVSVDSIAHPVKGLHDSGAQISVLSPEIKVKLKGCIGDLIETDLISLFIKLCESNDNGVSVVMAMSNKVNIGLILSVFQPESCNNCIVTVDIVEHIQCHKLCLSAVTCTIFVIQYHQALKILQCVDPIDFWIKVFHRFDALPNYKHHHHDYHHHRHHPELLQCLYGSICFLLYSRPSVLARIQFYVGKSYGFVVSIINLSSQYTYDCIITSIYIELIQPIMFSGVSAA